MSCVTSSTVCGSSASAPASHSCSSRARDRIQRAEGLVEQEHVLAGEERAQEGDALAHAGGETRGAQPLGAFETEAGEERARLRRVRRRGSFPRSRARWLRCRAPSSTAAANRPAASARSARGGRRRRLRPATGRRRGRARPARRRARAAWTCRFRCARRSRAARAARRPGRRRRAPACRRGCARRRPARSRRSLRPCVLRLLPLPSLRRHDPDQVRRVRARKRSLSPSAGAPRFGSILRQGVRHSPPAATIGLDAQAGSVPPARSASTTCRTRG